jgi:GNAT superfamily N-acetyltransferase
LNLLVEFWNEAFGDRRNFRPLTAAEFEQRVLGCPAFDPQGLILAWQTNDAGRSTLVGVVHAMRPAPNRAIYRSWDRYPTLALIYVQPGFRHRGVGSSLLRAAEDWLYYCPVHFAGPTQPCYGVLEGPRPPFFGSTQRMGVNAHDRDLIRFLAHRGYVAVDPGDVSLRLDPLPDDAPPPVFDLAAHGLRLQVIDHTRPFMGHEPEGREAYTLWGANHGEPYAGFVLVDASELLHGHVAWYPMSKADAGQRWAALVNYWVAPARRRQGLGRFLLDLALHEMAHALPPRGGYQAVEVQTHLIHHARAAQMYHRRNFVIDAAWVNLVKQ